MNVDMNLIDSNLVDIIKQENLRFVYDVMNELKLVSMQVKLELRIELAESNVYTPRGLTHKYYLCHVYTFKLSNERAKSVDH